MMADQEAANSPGSGYSLLEEVANSISHGLGVLFGVSALTLMLNSAIVLGDSSRIISGSIYGASIILLFLASTLYHAIPNEKAKVWLKLFDHSAIYLLIAGTYTPFLMIALASETGNTMLWVVWLIAATGLLFKFIFLYRFKPLSVVTYLAMGWLSVLIMDDLVTALPEASIDLLMLGGLLFTFGVVFYVAKKIPYNHAIWHLFVLGGAFSHFLSIYLFLF